MASSSRGAIGRGRSRHERAPRVAYSASIAEDNKGCQNGEDDVGIAAGPQGRPQLGYALTGSRTPVATSAAREG